MIGKVRLVGVLKKKEIRKFFISEIKEEDLPTPSSLRIINRTMGSGCLPSSESCLITDRSWSRRSLKGMRNCSVYAPDSSICDKICWQKSLLSKAIKRQKRMIVHENTYSHGSNLAVDRRCLSALPDRQEEETEQTKDIGQKLIDSISLWQRRRLCG